MTSRTRKLLAQVGSFLLAAILLYLALRGVDLGSLLSALRTADYRWLLPLVVVILGSHALRAWRWKLLLETLPERKEASGQPVSLKTAFYSVMIGYMVNYAAPRLGEVVRTGNLAARERLRFSSVFGTVVAERVLDVIVLLAALLSVFLLFLNRFAVLNELFFEPVQERLGQAGGLALIALVGGMFLLLTLIAARLLARREGRLYPFWQQRIVPVLASFKEGLLTLARCPRRVGLVVSTGLIWFGYLLTAYFPLRMLGLASAYSLSLLDTWAIMILGALGIAVPSPGGTGSYHYITKQTLVHLFGVASNPAMAYAVLTHAAQLILYALVGFLCLVLQGTSLRTLRRRSEEAHEDAASTPSSAAAVSPGESTTPAQRTG